MDASFNPMPGKNEEKGSNNEHAEQIDQLLIDMEHYQKIEGDEALQKLIEIYNKLDELEPGLLEEVSVRKHPNEFQIYE